MRNLQLDEYDLDSVYIDGDMGCLMNGAGDVVEVFEVQPEPEKYSFGFEIILEGADDE